MSRDLKDRCLEPDRFVPNKLSVKKGGIGETSCSYEDYLVLIENYHILVARICSR